MAECCNRYKLRYTFDNATGNASLDSIVEVRDASNNLLASPVTHLSGSPGFAAAVASAVCCEDAKIPDSEVVCITEDANPGTPEIGLLVIDASVTPPTFTLYRNGVDVTSSWSQAPCAPDQQDYELRESCLQNAGGDRFTRIDWFESDNLVNPVSTIYYNRAANTYGPDPGGLTQCVDEADPLPQSDEVLILCDDNGPFLQHITNDGAGVKTYTASTLTGAAYVPAGTVAPCQPTPNVVDSEFETLCDSDQEFLRHYSVDNQGVVTSVDTELDGTTPYTPNGTITKNCVQSSTTTPDEIDLLYTDFLPVCVDGAQWYVADRTTFNNVSGTESAPTKVWKQGAAGAISDTAPAGTMVDGYCYQDDLEHDTEVGCLFDLQTQQSRQVKVVDTVDDAGAVTTTYAEVDGTPITLSPTQSVTQGPCRPVTVTESVDYGCADGVPYTRRRNVFRTGDGQTIAEAIGFFDSDGNEQPAAPAGFTLGPCPQETVLNEVACLTPSGELGREIEVIKTVATDGSVSVVYHELNGDVITPAATDVITLGDCKCVQSVGEICYEVIEVIDEELAPVAFNPATSSFVNADEGEFTVSASAQNNSNQIIATYDGPFTTFEWEYVTGDAGFVSMGARIETAETGFIDLTPAEWSPPLPTAQGVDGDIHTRVFNGITVTLQEINGGEWLAFTDQLYARSDGTRFRITFDTPITNFQIRRFNQSTIASTKHFRTFGKLQISNLKNEYGKANVFIDCSGQKTYRDVISGELLVDPKLIPCPEADTSIACIRPAGGVPYEVLAVASHDNDGTVNIRYYDTEGNLVTPADTDVVSHSACKCPIDVCYQIACLTSSDPVQITTSDAPAILTFDNAVVTNPSQSVFTNIAATHDGNGSSATNYGGLGAAPDPGDANFRAEYIFNTPQNNIIGFGLLNNIGNILTDADGVGPCTTLTVFDAQGTALGSAPLNAGNGGGAFITSMGPFNNVTRVRWTGLCRLGGSTPKGFREFYALQTYQSRLLWNCGFAEVTASVTGPTGSSVEVSNGQLVQTGGPHTMTFESLNVFTGTIVTDKPASFSSLEVTNDSVVTVTGAGTADFVVEYRIEDARSVIKSGQKVCLYVPGQYDILDSQTGQVVPNAYQVPCIRDSVCLDETMIVGSLCYLDVTNESEPDPIAYDVATSNAVNNTQGAFTVAGDFANSSLGMVANYLGPLTVFEWEYKAGDSTGLISLGARIETDETGVIDWNTIQWQPPLPNSQGSSTTFYSMDNYNGTGVTIGLQELNGGTWVKSGDQLYLRSDETRFRLTFGTPVHNLKLMRFGNQDVGTTEHFETFSYRNNNTARYRMLTVAKDCDGEISYRDTSTGDLLTNPQITPCPDSSSAVACISRDGETLSVTAVSTYDTLGNYYIKYYNPEGARVLLQPTDVVTFGPCTPLATTTNTTVSRSSVSNAGSTAAGAQGVSFVNVGTSNVTVGGVTLLPGETVDYQGYYDNEEAVYKRLPAIAYVATGGTLHISVIN